jgi:hypothetical protein
MALIKTRQESKKYCLIDESKLWHLTVVGPVSSSRGDTLVSKNMERGPRLSNSSEYRLWAEGEESCVTFGPRYALDGLY